MDLGFIYAYIVTQFIRPQDWVSGVEGSRVVLYLLIPAILVGLVKKFSSGRSIKLPQNYFVFGFLFMVLASNILNATAENGIDQFVLFVKRSLVFFIFLLYLDTPRKIRRVLDFVVLMALFLAIEGIFQAKTGVGLAGQTLMPGYEEVRIRWIGDWDGPNVLAVLFVAGFGFCLEYMLNGYSSIHRKAFALISGGVLFYAVYLTNSRGGYLALVFTVVVAGFKRTGLKLKYILPAVAVLFLVLQFAAPKRMSGQHSKEESARERLWLWEQGISMTMDKPLYGVGKGNFKKQSYQNLVAHNNYIQQAAEIGLVGFFVWLGIMYFSFKGVYMVLRQDAAPALDEDDLQELRMVGGALLTSLAGFAAATMFVTMEFDLLWILWGLSGAAVLAADGCGFNVRKDIRLSDLLGIGAGATGVLAVIFLLVVRN